MNRVNINVVNFDDELTAQDLYNEGTEVIKSEHLPSYVDDVVEYDSVSDFPATGESGKIYVAKDTGKTYRWSGSQYVLVSSPSSEDITYDGSLESHASGSVGAKLASLDANKVDKEQGKGLSTNDYTTAEKDKLGGIETGADVNTIETIKRNGTALTPDENKAVNIEVPTTAEELTYDPAAASHTTGSVGAQLSTLSIEVGVLSDLTTTAKTSLVAAVNEVNGAIGTIGTILDTINGQVI